MLPSVIASAIAARDLGYPSIAALILERQLGPQAIARMFRISAAPDAGHVGAVILYRAVQLMS